MKVTNGQAVNEIGINQRIKSSNVSNPNVNSAVSADKVFSYLSFKAAAAQAQIQTAKTIPVNFRGQSGITNSGAEPEKNPEDIRFLRRAGAAAKRFLKQFLSGNKSSLSVLAGLAGMSEAEYAKLSVPFLQRPVEGFDEDKYREDIKVKIKQPLDYNTGTIRKLKIKSLLKSGLSNIVQNISENALKYHFNTRFDFKKFDSKEDAAPVLPSADDLMQKLQTDGSVSLQIQNRGGANPVKTETAEIRKEDEAKPGKTENAGISIKYGENTGWSNFKIARDVMQNFYDGNGYTLEGVNLKIAKNNDGSYKIRIDGLGKYDYSHLEVLGSSTKNDDFSAAGHFGEGTRILAVNLLSKLDTTSVKYSSGDWAMEFNRSSDDINSAYMTQTLTKNKERIDGNYIEFNTKNKDLVKTILESKDYFYHPDNPDFKNLDFENEFFGIKFLPKQNKSGNLYLVQRYEYEGRNENSLKNLRVIFKKMPNDPELVKLNGGKEYNAETGRDRTEISRNALSTLLSRYIKTMKDEDLTKLICTLEPCFNTETAENYQFGAAALLLETAVNETYQRHAGINFENYMCGSSPFFKDFAQNSGCKTAIEIMDKAGMSKFIPEISTGPFMEPDEKITAKIRLLNEGVRVLSECADLSTIDIINPSEPDTPKYPFKPGSEIYPDAEAIIEKGIYRGHWVSDEFIYGPFTDNLSTWLHELSHKAGGDGFKSFAEQLKKMQQFIINSLVHNPAALNKLKVLAELYEDSNSSVKQTKSNTEAFSEQKYEAEIKAELAKSSPYKEFTEAGASNSNAVYRKREKAVLKAHAAALPDSDKLMKTLNSDGSVSLQIQNRGGAKPVKTETAEIKKEDEAQLGKTENAGISIKYGENTGWSNFKIARDVMQNFYDGNGYTLEGVNLKITKNNDGSYKIRIDGLGKYDYSHLEVLGSSTKNDDFSAAGHYGEGTRILAVNLLSKLDTTSVKYSSGDWAMEFNRSSDDINSAYMTQILTKNKEHIDGNYIEFNTKNKDLVKTILDSKDYFYHPDNPDFKNLDFENEFFGFRVQKDPGNIYYIQRYQTPDGKVSGGMDGLNVVFKKQQNALSKYIKNEQDESRISLFKPKHFSKHKINPAAQAALRILFAEAMIKTQCGCGEKTISLSELNKMTDSEKKNEKQQSLLSNINTGRDRNKLEASDIYTLALNYAQTMTDNEIISAIGSFEELITSNNPNDKKLKEYYDSPSPAFIAGIIQEAANRNIKFNSKDAKIVWVPNSKYAAPVPSHMVSYLKKQGYKFGISEYSDIGIKSAEELYKEIHQKKSTEPSKQEAQKLKILTAALKLFKGNLYGFYMPNLGENPLYIYEKGDDKNHGDYHAVYEGENFKAVFIDRQILAKNGFMETLARVMSELKRKKDTVMSTYTYDLTNLIRLELDTLISKPETAQKLKVLERLYNEL